MRPPPRLLAGSRAPRCQLPRRQSTSIHGRAATEAASSRLSLEHIRLRPPAGAGFVSYAAASALQESLRAPFFAWKAAPAVGVAPTTEAPGPKLLSFTPAPTYTLGRRQKSLAPEQLARLQTPLAMSTSGAPSSQTFLPGVVATLRGGLTTYHGPGQLVLWPVLDLHSPLHRELTVRRYARLLESTTAAVLESEFGLRTYTSDEEPGVWVDDGGPERKIAAMGVALRRHITGLGIALNVDVPVVGGEDVNPWARFVPCGLEDKAVTSLAAELGQDWAGRRSKDLDSISSLWAREFAAQLEIADISTREEIPVSIGTIEAHVG